MFAYLFDRKSWALLWLMVFALGLLLFLAGYMVGLHRQLPPSAEASLPTVDPVSGFDLSSVEKSLPASAEALPAAAAPPPPAPAPPPPAPAPPPPARAATSSASAEPAAGASADSDPPVQTAAATSSTAVSTPAEPAEQADEPAAQPAQLYSIQVAALIEAASVPLEIARLQAKGYLPYTVKIEDEHGRRLTAIRIGRYESVEEAERAAQAFEQDVGGDTPLVRPYGAGS